MEKFGPGIRDKHPGSATTDSRKRIYWELFPIKTLPSYLFIDWNIFQKGLARVMGQKYRRKLESKNGKQTVKRKEATTGQGEVVVPGQQKRKKKRLIGVVKVRFYPPKDTDVASLILALDAIEDNTVAAAREAVYREHREAVQQIFNLSPDIKTCIAGFFDDPLHCRTHAEYLAERSVLEAVESDFSNLFDDVQSVVSVWAKTEASKQRMEAARLRCLEPQAGFRIRIQYFRLNTGTYRSGSGYGSRVLMTKNWKKFTAEKFLNFFWIKNYNLPIPRPL
jgi:hypothetical protein